MKHEDEMAYSEQVNTAHGLESESKPLGTWEYFAGWLLDNCEGETVYEESLQRWLAESEKERLQRWPESTTADKWQSILDYIDSRPAEQKEVARIALEYTKPIVEAELDVLRGRVAELEDRHVLIYNKHEIQSGASRIDWAEGLIEQLPDTHDGRNSWLLNYGTRPKAQTKRLNDSRVFEWDYETECIKNSTMSKETEPQADIKARYAKAKEAEENGGLVVKVFWRTRTTVIREEMTEWEHVQTPKWYLDREYELRFYEIDWNKVPSGTPVTAITRKYDKYDGVFIGVDLEKKLVCTYDAGDYKGLDWFETAELKQEPKPEWLKEVEK